MHLLFSKGHSLTCYCFQAAPDQWAQATSPALHLAICNYKQCPHHATLKHTHTRARAHARTHTGATSADENQSGKSTS
jgi:hypothetical protein